MKESELGKPAKVATKKGEKDGEGTSKLYGEWQTEPWVPKPAVDGKVRLRVCMEVGVPPRSDWFGFSRYRTAVCWVTNSLLQQGCFWVAAAAAADACSSKLCQLYGP